MMTLIFNFIRAIFKNFLSKLKNFVSPKSIKGELALVTGGGNGLGRKLCIELAREGCDLAIVDVDIEGAEKTAQECEEIFKVKCKSFKCDISNVEAVLELKNKIEREMRSVDVLVNNAAIAYGADFIESRYEHIKRVIEVNFTSQIYVRKFWSTN